MPDSHSSLWINPLKEKFLFLLIALLSMILLTPLLRNFVGISILMDIFITIVFIAGIYAVSSKRLFSAIAFLLALPTFVITWFSTLRDSAAFIVLGDGAGALFTGFMLITILSFIVKEKKVSANVIYGAIVAYLLMAIMWAFVYRVLETLQPGSFNMVQGHALESRSLFTYFSFVTLTTLGYGDITPATDAARSFAIVEALAGQIYLVVLVARLVGIHIAQTIEEK